MISALTLKSSKGVLRQLLSPVEITLPGDISKIIKVNALWDTGAGSTVITQKVVDAIGSVLISKANVHTASESNVITEVHLVDLLLNDKGVRIGGLNVTVGKLTGFDCLIGMDIITLGDFSITNHNSMTCMSFRVPSEHEVDYVKLFQDSQSIKQSNADYMKRLRGGKK